MAFRIANFGSVLRTADAAVSICVIARSRNVAVTPVVSNVACGAAERRRWPRWQSGPFPDHIADWDPNIGRTSQQPRSFDADLTGPVALIMGGEGEGMRRLTRERCDLLVQLPMQGVVESLTSLLRRASVSTSASGNETALHLGKPSGSIRGPQSARMNSLPHRDAGGRHP